MQENIPDIEDREFQTSKGNWQGDFQWEQEPCPGEKTAITAELSSTKPTAEETLSAPYIKAQPGYDHTLNINISAHGGTLEGATGYAEITDGVYTYGIYNLLWFGCGFPRLNQLYVTIPDDWDINNTKLTIHFDYAIGGGFLNVTHVNFQSPGPPTPVKIDYLPLMGIG
jgi:hypothetical protein